MGVFATCFMDLLSGFLAKRKLIYHFISPDAIGRWFLYIFRGKLIHKDISKSPELKNEKLWSVISHYLIGVVLAGVYLLLESNLSIIREHIWMSLLFGIATVFLTSVHEIKKVKESEGADLQVHGSGELVQTLLKHDLVDELWLKIFPITLHTGKRLFGEGTIPAAFTLTESTVTPSGIIIANYKRGGEVKTGTIGV